MRLTTFGGKMSGEGGEKGAVTSYSLEVSLAAMLGGGRDGDKPVPARLLTWYKFSPFLLSQLLQP